MTDDGFEPPESHLIKQLKTPKNESHMSGEERLARRILYKALLESRAWVAGTYNSSKALEWLLEDNEYFFFWCDTANINAKEFRRYIRQTYDEFFQKHRPKEHDEIG